ncbi:MerR family transcriptional regulator [Actinoallomurus vinaceus]|uniref:MerR family transcriptional regulator n=1 Tax=Actinoallomurus vinaceus TaxID=1080074 RepID=A0ABP8UJ06_9ACTN
MRLDGVNEDGCYTIGQVARLSGLSVPTVRYYSDAGLVPPTGRTAGGYRIYDREALTRLELVRTLRDLGVDLATVARVLAGAETLGEAADRQIAALEVQIQALRVRQAVLRHVVTNDADAADMARANRLARLSAEQRRRTVADLIEEATRGLDMEPGFAAHLRSMLPDLPEAAEPGQIEAWVELARLVGDEEFRADVRQAFERHAADRVSGADGGDPSSWRQAEKAVVELAGRALATGISSTAAEAGPIVEELVAVFADAHRRRDDGDFRSWLAERLRIGANARVSRYWTLLAVINGRPTKTDPVRAAQWFLAALKASGNPPGAGNPPASHVPSPSGVSPSSGT